MTALLEVPAIRERVQGLTVEGYHRLGELGLLSKKVELLRSIVIAKMPKSPLHELLAQKLMRRLLAQVPEEYEVRPERPLTFGDSEPGPDFSVVQGRPDDWARAHPSTAHLVVEVSISSLAVDESKAELYAQAGVPEYWLVRVEERLVDVYRQPAPAGYGSRITLAETETLRCTSLPGIAIPITDILPPPPHN